MILSYCTNTWPIPQFYLNQLNQSYLNITPSSEERYKLLHEYQEDYFSTTFNAEITQIFPRNKNQQYHPCYITQRKLQVNDTVTKKDLIQTESQDSIIAIQIDDKLDQVIILTKNYTIYVMDLNNQQIQYQNQLNNYFANKNQDASQQKLYYITQSSSLINQNGQEIDISLIVMEDQVLVFQIANTSQFDVYPITLNNYQNKISQIYLLNNVLMVVTQDKGINDQIDLYLTKMNMQQSKFEFQFIKTYTHEFFNLSEKLNITDIAKCFSNQNIYFLQCYNNGLLIIQIDSTQMKLISQYKSQKQNQIIHTSQSNSIQTLNNNLQFIEFAYNEFPVFQMNVNKIIDLPQDYNNNNSFQFHQSIKSRLFTSIIQYNSTDLLLVYHSYNSSLLQVKELSNQTQSQNIDYIHLLNPPEKTLYYDYKFITDSYSKLVLVIASDKSIYFYNLNIQAPQIICNTYWQFFGENKYKYNISLYSSAYNFDGLNQTRKSQQLLNLSQIYVTNHTIEMEVLQDLEGKIIEKFMLVFIIIIGTLTILLFLFILYEKVIKSGRESFQQQQRQMKYETMKNGKLHTEQF